jgi:hypothetical protein
MMVLMHCMIFRATVGHSVVPMGCTTQVLVQGL